LSFAEAPFTSKMYEEATAHLEDIFQNETLVQLRNNSLYNLKEIRTSTYGWLIVLNLSPAENFNF
jgi:hypothetical protein